MYGQPSEHRTKSLLEGGSCGSGSHYSFLFSKAVEPYVCLRTYFQRSYISIIHANLFKAGLAKKRKRTHSFYILMAGISQESQPYGYQIFRK